MDEQITQMIKRCFEGVTMLVIAHRIRTIIDLWVNLLSPCVATHHVLTMDLLAECLVISSDKVLVMSEGRVVGVSKLASRRE
jgi:hypothetical protein